MTANGHDGRRYVLISADGHAGAGLQDYKPYLESAYHEEFDRWAATFTDGWAALDALSGDLRAGVSSYLSRYNWDSAARQEYLEAEGIAAEVLFPNTAPPFYPSGSLTAPGPRSTREYELRFAGIKAHNRWLADFCAETPGRRAGLAQLLLDDVPAAIAEARWAKEHGFNAVLLPADHVLKLTNLYYPEYEPLWAACADHDLTIARHGVLPAESAQEAGAAAPAVGLFEAAWMGQRGLAHMVLSGVFERHPTLRMTTTELNAAWAVSLGATLDYFIDEGQIPGTILAMFCADAAANLSMKPSEYIRRNCYFAGFFNDADVESRTVLGADRLMWGADFPHHEGTPPFTTEALRVNFAALPEDEVRQMTSLTAAECYGFDLTELQPIADRIGPTPDEIAAPLAPESYPSYPDETVCCSFDRGFDGNALAHA